MESSSRTRLALIGFIVVGTVVVCFMLGNWVGSSDQPVILVTVSSSLLLAAVVVFMVRYATVPRFGLWRVRRRSIERVVIGQIAAVVRQNLPMSTGLALAAQGEKGRERSLLGRIASWLGQGLPLSQAVRLGYQECPSLVLSLIAAGEKAGQLPAALDQAEQYLIERDRRRERWDMNVGAYVAFVLLFEFTLVSFIMVAVIPKFKDIFQDFGARLPGVTARLIDFCEWLVMGMPPGWVVCAVPAALLVGFYVASRVRRVPDLPWPARTADWIRWHVPGLRRLEWAQGMAVMLQTMRLGVRSGMRLDQAALLAAEIDVNVQLRPRMAQLAGLLAEGRAVREAAQEAGLGGVAGIALATGQRTGDMEGALRYAADYHDALISRWWIIATNLAWPACTIMMSVLAGMVVLALFLPLVTLINATAG